MMNLPFKIKVSKSMEANTAMILTASMYDAVQALALKIELGDIEPDQALAMLEQKTREECAAGRMLLIANIGKNG